MRRDEKPSSFRLHAIHTGTTVRTVRRILVAIRDTQHAPRSALRKAASPAKATRARIELFHAISEPVQMSPIRHSVAHPSSAETERLIAQKRLASLERIARSAIFRGVTVESAALWDYPPHEAIIRRSRATRADLVDPFHEHAKPAQLDQRILEAARAFIGSTAEHTLDEIESDVLIIKPRGFKASVARARRLPLVA